MPFDLRDEPTLLVPSPCLMFEIHGKRFDLGQRKPPTGHVSRYAIFSRRTSWAGRRMAQSSGRARRRDRLATDCIMQGQCGSGDVNPDHGRDGLGGRDKVWHCKAPAWDCLRARAAQGGPYQVSKRNAGPELDLDYNGLSVRPIPERPQQWVQDARDLGRHPAAGKTLLPHPETDRPGRPRGDAGPYLTHPEPDFPQPVARAPGASGRPCCALANGLTALTMNFEGSGRIGTLQDRFHRTRSYLATPDGRTQSGSPSPMLTPARGAEMTEDSYICSARPSASSTASCIVSDSVGCGKMV